MFRLLNSAEGHNVCCLRWILAERQLFASTQILFEICVYVNTDDGICGNASVAVSLFQDSSLEPFLQHPQDPCKKKL